MNQIGKPGPMDLTLAPSRGGRVMASTRRSIGMLRRGTRRVFEGAGEGDRRGSCAKECVKCAVAAR
jgi:hypothetical protein